MRLNQYTFRMMRTTTVEFDVTVEAPNYEAAYDAANAGDYDEHEGSAVVVAESLPEVV